MPLNVRYAGLILLFLALLAGCAWPAATPLAGTPTATPAESSAFQVYFTHPRAAAHDLRGGPDAAVAQAIDRARVSVDAALYDLNLWSIRDALLRAQRRGVQVRIVAETDHLDRSEFRALQAAGIPVVGDGRKALMHDKFVVIDRYQVWTGSMNFTLNGAYRNDNDLVAITSPRLAQDYTAEFEEMAVAHRFGADSPANTPFPRLSVDGIPLEVYFAPEDHPLRHVLPVVRGAKKHIVLMVFNFTNRDLARLLVAQAQQGVVVEGVFDRRQAEQSQGNQYAYLRRAGLDVRLDGNPYAMHHKVLVVDDRFVIFGSYNFTRSAETRNDENLLIVEDPLLAAQFLAEFQRVEAQTTAYNQDRPLFVGLSQAWAARVTPRGGR